MKLPTVESDPLLNKAKANKFALWRTFDYIGKNALLAVLAGRVSEEKAHEHLQMLRKMTLEETATYQDVKQHLERNKLWDEDCNLEHYPDNKDL